ncbi:MAG: SGNH/GDSL hydrolase family protein [Elusimicrobia bacterium]|nr:SGNH/GDSL hydrolase family protein [Elusimicrobiota bacterium]
MRAKTKRGALLRKAALAAAGVVFGLLVGESILRAFRLLPDDVVQMRMRPSPYTILERGPGFIKRGEAPYFAYVPGRVVTLTYSLCRGWHCLPDRSTEWRMNSDGMRDVEHAVSKPKNVFRIAVLGDSFSIGMGLGPDEAYAKQLERMLNARYRGRPRFEVLNFAVAGYSTYDEWKDLLKRGLKYSPDLILVGMYINDAYPSVDSERRNPPEAIQFLRIEQRLLRSVGRASNVVSTVHFPRWSYVARWIMRFAYAQKVNRVSQRWYKLIWGPRNPAGQRQFEEALSGLETLSRGKKLPVLVAVLPKLDWLNEKYPRWIHKRIRGQLADHGIATVELLRYVMYRDPSSFWVHPTDHHPNEQVHRLIASVVLERLLSDTTLRLPKPPPPAPVTAPTKSR